MAVPSSIADLSVTAASNSPAGSESIGTSLDDYLRSIQAIIKQENSKGSDIASSSTITIPAVGSYFVITGTTTITAISDSWAGRQVALRFSGVLTFTHSAGLILPGSANITTAAGDACLVVNESTGVWRVVAYQKANGSSVASDVSASSTTTFTNKTITDPTNTIYATAGPSGTAFTFRNKIIGGDFTTNPWQRGTSFTAPASGLYVADRWLVANTSAAVVDVFKTADAPTAAQAGVFTQHCLHLDVTTADASIAAGDQYSVRQHVEGLNAASFGFGQAGTRYVTLSFWHKHTKTGIYCVGVLNSAVNRSYVVEYTQDVTDTWEQATITVPVDTSGTWLYDNGRGVGLFFAVAAGSTFHTTANTWAAGNFFATANQVNALDSTANNFKIALVQLEAGSVATPFESRPYGVELALCQRYYYRLTVASPAQPIGAAMWADNATAGRATGAFPVSMRSIPSALEQTGTAGDYVTVTGGTVRTCTSVPTFEACIRESWVINTTVASGQTAGQAGYLRSAGTAAYLGFTAEL